MDNFSEIYRKIVFKFNKPKVPILNQIPINVLSPPKSNPKWESQNLDLIKEHNKRNINTEWYRW